MHPEISTSSQYRPAMESSPVEKRQPVMVTFRQGRPGEPRKWTPSQPPVIFSSRTSTSSQSSMRTA